ncbi:hypothetical protein AAFF_G00239640 [Aldrovandia affinis]|uniref:Uncharacterized protein n=1 Tax=Aldrovandia affinis TaxID=143900 RepID=A0AAD7VWQ9_9TELE|nr:hypothetical protein AAFF_G00239640 [Aldrovandia affinis]
MFKEQRVGELQQDRCLLLLHLYCSCRQLEHRHRRMILFQESLGLVEHIGFSAAWGRGKGLGREEEQAAVADVSCRTWTGCGEFGAPALPPSSL